VTDQISYRETDPVSGRWIETTGANLTAYQFDYNTYQFDRRLAVLEAEPPSVGISTFSISGNQLTVVMTDTSTRGPYTLPTSIPRNRGAWLPSTAYLVNDWIVANGAVYAVIFNHTSGSSFDPNANDGLGHNYYQLVISVTQRKAVADAAYSATIDDRLIAYTSISAARAVALPAASAYPTGYVLTVVDESGSCSATNTITLNRAGSDTINGASSAVIAVAYGYVSIESNGSNAWTIVDQPPTGLTGGVLPLANGGTGATSASGAQKNLAIGALIVSAQSVNANSVADTALTVPLPSGFTKYRVNRITALNPSISLTTAQAALYTAAAAGGVAVASPQALSGLTTNSASTSGNAIDLSLALAAPTFFTAATLYFRITTAQGAAATVDVVLEIQPYE
jgi:hypothetical protein